MYKYTYIRLLLILRILTDYFRRILYKDFLRSRVCTPRLTFTVKSNVWEP